MKARTLAELTTEARANPGKLSMGTAEVSARIIGERFKSSAGIDILNVPYKGTGPMITDLLGSHIDVGMVSLPAAFPHQKTGALKLLAVSTAKRNVLAPELLTLAESGVKDFDLSIWYALLAPAGTPTDILNKIQNDVVQIALQTDFKANLQRMGLVPLLNTPQAFATFLREEVAESANDVKQIGLKPE